MAAGPRKRLQRVAGRCGSRDLLAATMRPLIVKQLKYDLTPVAGLALVGPPPEAAGAGVQAARQGAAGEDGRVQQRHRAQLRRTARARQVGIRLPSRTSAGTRSSSNRWASHRAAAVERDAAPAPGCASGGLVGLRAGAHRDLAEQRPARLRRAVVRLAAAGCRHLRDGHGGTVKEGVGRTYAGVDGYCPLVAYLGSHGFCLELALRPGVQHSSLETPFNFERVIPMAQRLSAAGRRRRSDPGGGQGGKRPGGADLQRPRLRDLFAAAPELAPPARQGPPDVCRACTVKALQQQPCPAAAHPPVLHRCGVPTRKFGD